MNCRSILIMQIISHRGANHEFPENTLAAFDRSLQIGVDALETDLLITKDGHIVCRHDDLIQKDGRWFYLSELTLEELQTIDLGGGHKVPAFEALLERYQSRLPLLLDLKCRGLAEKIKSLFARIGRKPEGIHFTSFLHEEIRSLSQIFPDAGLSIVLAAVPISFQKLFEESRSREISLFRGYLDEPTVRRLRENGIKVRVYPVNLAREAEKFQKWGIDGIFTDDPTPMQAFRG